MPEKLAPEELPQNKPEQNNKVRVFVNSVRGKICDLLRPDVPPFMLENAPGWTHLIQGSLIGLITGTSVYFSSSFSRLSSLHPVIQSLSENPVITIGGCSILTTMCAAYPLVFHKPIPPNKR